MLSLWSTTDFIRVLSLDSVSRQSRLIFCEEVDTYSAIYSRATALPSPWRWVYLGISKSLSHLRFILRSYGVSLLSSAELLFSWSSEWSFLSYKTSSFIVSPALDADGRVVVSDLEDDKDNARYNLLRKSWCRWVCDTFRIPPILEFQPQDGECSRF